MLDVLPLLTFGAVSLVVAMCLVAWGRGNASAEVMPIDGAHHTEGEGNSVVVLSTGMTVTAVMVIGLVMLAGGQVVSSARIGPLLGLIGSVVAGLLYVVRKRSPSSVGQSPAKQSGEDVVVVVTEQ